jgi:hypothetical protein
MATEKPSVVIVGGAAGGFSRPSSAKPECASSGSSAAASYHRRFNPRRAALTQRQDLRPNVKRWPVTWRPNANARVRWLPFSTTATSGRRHCTARSLFGGAAGMIFSALADHHALAAQPRSEDPRSFITSYADLEPTTIAEYDLGVSGKAGNLQGQKSTAATYSGAAPRDYPAAAA